MSRLSDLKKEWENCERCDLHKTRTNVVFGDGNPKADILIVGEGPGENEDESGTPFVGEAGTILNQFLQDAVLDRDHDIFITNVVACRPTAESVDDRTGQMRIENRPPTKVERLACRTRLVETIYQIDPLLIVTIGKVPFQALCGRASKMASVRGRMQTCHLEGRHTMIRYGVMPMYHTAFLYRTQDRRKEGPWGRTGFDWARICNVIDYLREAYYGLPQPDREAVLNAQAAAAKRR